MTQSLKLYETTESLRIVEEWIDEHADEIIAAGGALPPELESLLNGAQMDFRKKAERVALKIQSLLATANAVDFEMTRLENRKRHFDLAAKGLKEYLRVQMEIAGERVVEGELCQVRIQKSPPTVTTNISQEEIQMVVPQRFVTHKPATYDLNRRAIIDAWKLGEDVEALLPGTRIEQRTHLRII